MIIFIILAVLAAVLGIVGYFYIDLFLNKKGFKFSVSYTGTLKNPNELVNANLTVRVGTFISKIFPSEGLMIGGTIHFDSSWMRHLKTLDPSQITGYLVAHEYYHTVQADEVGGPFKFLIKYLFNGKFRKNAEKEADAFGQMHMLDPEFIQVTRFLRDSLTIK